MIVGLVGFVWWCNQIIWVFNIDLEQKVMVCIVELENVNMQLQEYLEDLKVFMYIIFYDLKELFCNIFGFFILFCC